MGVNSRISSGLFLVFFSIPIFYSFQITYTSVSKTVNRVISSHSVVVSTFIQVLYVTGVFPLHVTFCDYSSEATIERFASLHVLMLLITSYFTDAEYQSKMLTTKL